MSGGILTTPEGTAGPPGPPGPEGPQGPPGASATVFNYRAETLFQQAQDPGAGNIRWNTVDQLQATSLYIDWLTADGFDAHMMLKWMHTPVGMKFIIQDHDFALVYQEWKLLEVIEYPDWFEVRVQLIASSGTGAMQNNKLCSILVFAEAVGPQGPKGDTGVQGPQGPQGPKGDTGTVAPLSGPSLLVGSGSAGGGSPREIQIGGGLTMTGTLLQSPRSSTLVNYTYNSSVVEPPAAGQVRINALHPFTAATKLWIRFVSADGQDVYWGIMVIEVGMTLLFQDKDDHTLYARFTVAGTPIDKGLYAEIPVAWASNGGAIATAQQILMQRSGGGTSAALLAQMSVLENRIKALEAK